MQFRVWYADGETYDVSSIEEWKALPSEGVLIVVKYQDTGRTFYVGADWYWIEGEEVKRIKSGPWGTDKPPPTDVCLDCVKKYGVVSDEEMKRIHAEAWHGD